VSPGFKTTSTLGIGLLFLCDLSIWATTEWREIVQGRVQVSRRESTGLGGMSSSGFYQNDFSFAGPSASLAWKDHWFPLFSARTAGSTDTTNKRRCRIVHVGEPEVWKVKRANVRRRPCLGTEYRIYWSF